MSKMSQLHAELTEQAYDLGFSSIEEAEANGYEIDYDRSMLVDGRELAHEAWIKEKETLLAEAGELLEDADNFEPTAYDDLKNMVRSLMEFIKKGEI